MKDSKPKAKLLIPQNVQDQLVSLYSYAKINKNIAMSCLTEDVCSKYQNVIRDNNGSVNILMGLFKKQTTHKKIKRALL